MKAGDESIRNYVFLDLETCGESNWPIYEGGYQANSDSGGGRIVPKTYQEFSHLGCNAMQDALASPALEPPGSKLLVFDCSGNGPRGCFSRQTQKDERVVLLSISAHENQHIRSIDQGLPPPAVNPVILSLTGLQALNLCAESRPVIISFMGNFRAPVRQALRELHNNKSVIIFDPHTMQPGRSKVSAYKKLLAESSFAAVPRGDGLFSYRFTEAMSAGSIPVVFSDGWVLPFREELVSWGKCCIVVIKEDAVNQTLSILAQITEEKRCEMRRNGQAIYQKYMISAEGTIGGIIEGLERQVLALHEEGDVEKSGQDRGEQHNLRAYHGDQRT